VVDEEWLMRADRAPADAEPLFQYFLLPAFEHVCGLKPTK
jgi:hypothetical protein